MTEQINLYGKIAVITGAGSGIGRASAMLIARHGARVHVVDVNSEAAERVVGEIEAAAGSAQAHELDVSDPQAVEALAERVFAADRGVDILHNNAGIGHAGNIEATTYEDWQRVIAVNLLGVAYGVQAFVPRMLARGRPASVVNTASMAGIVPTAKMAPYCASKFGVVGMSESLNAELSPRHSRQRNMPRHHQHPDHRRRRDARRRRGDPGQGERLLRPPRRFARGGRRGGPEDDRQAQADRAGAAPAGERALPAAPRLAPPDAADRA